ncbi:putative E3 ubiquitin-protein ligase ATL45 [Iris pallida]|uniref:E3 ubiquitin-protein ligase ATL45 n=1 Tax=Iris pallida TaxID=29817 RepID=A0AAX6FFV5_IRIPA|nr:putative E3 ubiquitin-protein ligase ATL45 [Iris pallida]
MAAPESPVVAEPSGLLLPPLLMALGIILAVLLALLALHFLLKRLHAGDPPTTTASAWSQTSCACLGVGSKALDSLPVRAYSKGYHQQHECCVCLSALEDGALVRTLPACRHVFHCQCIDAWLASHSSCPFCRAEVTAAGAAESFVVPVDAIEGSNESLAREYCQHQRSNCLVWPKLPLKRCSSSPESCNVGSNEEAR